MQLTQRTIFDVAARDRRRERTTSGRQGGEDGLTAIDVDGPGSRGRRVSEDWFRRLDRRAAPQSFRRSRRDTHGLDSPGAALGVVQVRPGLLVRAQELDGCRRPRLVWHESLPLNVT